MDPKQETGISSDNTSLSATGRSVFANPQNRFKDTNPNGDILIPADKPASRKPRFSFGGGSGSGSGSGSGGTLNKPLIIGIAVIAILAIVAIVLAVVLPKGGSGNRSSGNTQSSNYAGDFDQYANYILYGDPTKSALEGEYSLSSIYTIDTALEDNDITFFETAKSYYDNFLDTYTSDEPGPALSGSVDEYTAVFDFVYRYATAELLSDDNIIEKYFELGLSGLNNLVDETYAELSNTTYEPGKAYAEAKVAYDRALVNLMSAYESNGCLSSGNIDETCAESIPYDGDLQGLAEPDGLSLIDGAVDDVKSLCWKISAILNGTSDYTSEIDDSEAEDVEGEE